MKITALLLNIGAKVVIFIQNRLSAANAENGNTDADQSQGYNPPDEPYVQCLASAGGHREGGVGTEGQEQAEQEVHLCGQVRLGGSGGFGFPVGNGKVHHIGEALDQDHDDVDAESDEGEGEQDAPVSDSVHHSMEVEMVRYRDSFQAGPGEHRKESGQHRHRGDYIE